MFWDKIKKVLVVVSHPDDEVLGCGGTIVELTGRGVEVRVVMLGGVTTSRFNEDPNSDLHKKDQFHNESEKAAKVLGVRKVCKFDIDDNRFDTVPFLEIVKRVEKVFEDYSPDLVITHDRCDLNKDHSICFDAVLTACRPLPKRQPFRIMAFEVLSSTEYQDPSVAQFRPNCYIDIRNTIGKKLEAMKCYESEIMAYPHPRSIDGIKSLAQKRGCEAGVDYAEAFRIVREVLIP